ncbi:MAG: Sec-independent protein translocase protein TatB [Pseudomonadota bacterium]
MFDLGWSEMLILAVVAIIVVGPKDLPRMLRQVGQFVGQARRMAREFTTQFQDAVKDSDLDDLRNDITKVDPLADLKKSLAEDFGSVDRDLQETIADYDRADEAENAAFEATQKSKAANENSASQADASSAETAATGDPEIERNALDTPDDAVAAEPLSETADAEPAVAKSSGG